MLPSTHKRAKKKSTQEVRITPSATPVRFLSELFIYNKRMHDTPRFHISFSCHGEVNMMCWGEPLYRERTEQDLKCTQNLLVNTHNNEVAIRRTEAGQAGTKEALRWKGNSIAFKTLSRPTSCALSVVRGVFLGQSAQKWMSKREKKPS